MAVQPTNSSIRVALFGGQGSKSLFASSTAAIARGNAASCPEAAILLSRCHAAFLEELSSVDPPERRSMGLEKAQFKTAEDVLVPSKEYHDHGLLQSTTLCLHQLLQYLAEVKRSESDFDAALDNLLETSGFCAGLIPATVVAASASVESFILFAVEAFRLSFWTGCRATLASLREYPNQISEPGSWTLVASGMTRVEMSKELDTFHSTMPSHKLNLSAVSGEKSISVSGPSQELGLFQKQIGVSCSTTFAHVHAWYHGGKALKAVVENVMDDLLRRNINFPRSEDLKKPVRSPGDGSICNLDSSNRLGVAEWVVRHIVVESVNWDTVCANTASRIESSVSSSQTAKAQLVSYGPSTKMLTGPIVSRLTGAKVEVVDLSPFHPSNQNSQLLTDENAIAIVGMSMNLPKGNGPKELWDTLSAGLSAVQEIPDSRFQLTEFYSEDSQKPRTMPIRHGAFLEDPFTFDNQFFNISPREAASMDPQQRILLHTSQAALDDAGYVKDATPTFQSASMGCYVGLATGDYTDNLRNDIDVFYSPGTLRAFHSGRISYVYKWSGPSIVTDTACSSSTVSIYQACRALQSGDCSSALAGGVNVISSPDMYLGLARGHFLSHTGGCKPFDESADGYTRAEGCVIFVLKRLSDAIAENDRIHGVIRDVVANQSGNAHSITHPHSETQIDLAKQLFRKTQVDPASVSVVEAHGTGTQAGDTREIASLKTIFGPSHSASNPLVVSSIKGNIGHCEAASGAAGLAKLLLMLRKGEVPMQASLKKLNSRITGLEDAGIVIPRKNLAWRSPSGHPRIAMLNNFGAAGSNAALLLEEPRQIFKAQCQERSAYVFNLSAKSKGALSVYISQYLDILAEKPFDESVKDICYTASARRQTYDYKISIPCRYPPDLISLLSRVKVEQISPRKAKDNMIFVFSGQGAIYPGMGAELMDTSPQFKSSIDLCDKTVRELGFGSIVPLIKGIRSDDPDADNDMVITQAACVAVEYALANLFMFWGIKPKYFIGHSLGEYAALAVSGTLTVADTMRMVVTRADMMLTKCDVDASGMLACKVPPAQAENMKASNPDSFSRIEVACRNSTSDCVLSGPLEQLEDFQDMCAKQKVKTKMLDVPLGFHSAAMDPISRPLEELGKSVTWAASSVPVISTVFGRQLQKEDMTSNYFAKHARQPVQFKEAIEQHTESGLLKDAICLEIGPHPITLSMVKATAVKDTPICIPTLQKGQPPWASLCAGISQLSLEMENLDWRAVFDGTLASMTEVPGHPLAGNKFLIPYQEPSSRQEINPVEAPKPSDGTGLPLIPRIVNGKSTDDQVEFESTDVILGPLISGHNVGGVCICPASVYAEMALEASQTCLQPSTDSILAIENLKFAHPLIYKPIGDLRTTSVHISKNGPSGVVDFKVSGVDNDQPQGISYCGGTIAGRSVQAFKEQSKKDAAIIRRQSTYLRGGSHQVSTFQTKVLYEAVFTRVVQYSPYYHTIKELTVSDSTLEGIGTFIVPPGSISKGYVVPPVFSDTLLHASGFIANLTVSLEEICICSDVHSIEVLYHDIDFTQTFTIYCSLVNVTKGVFHCDAWALNSVGEVVAKASGIEFKKLRLTTFRKLIGLDQRTNNSTEEFEVTPTIASSTPSVKETSSKPSSAPTAPPKDTMKPQDIRGTITGIIRNVGGFKEDDLDLTSPLDNLGIDSLMQIEITSKVMQSFPGHEINHNSLANCETILALEETVMSVLGLQSENSTVESSPSSESASTVGSMTPTSSVTTPDVSSVAPTPIHMNNDNLTPIFLFHDGSGTTSMYAKMRDLNRSAYAFSDPGMFDNKPHFETLEDMAAKYASEIAKMQLTEIILGGWSFGGVVAFEAARKLESSGTKVKGLLLIDSPYPINHTPLPEAVIRHVTASAGIGSNETIAKEFQRNAAMLGRYNPVSFQFSEGLKTVYLRSSDTFDTKTLCNVEYPWLSEQTCRTQSIKDWETLLGGSVEVLRIPGNHFEPFVPANITQTTKQILTACDIVSS